MLTVACILWPALAVDNPLKFRRYSLEHGLSQGSVISIIQDRQGFLWLGTQDGLNRFDGYQFKIFYSEQDEPNSVASNYIPSLHEDVNGTLWVGTTNGLDKLNRDNDTFIHYTLTEETRENIGSQYIRVISDAPNNKLWVGTYGGLFLFDPATGQSTRFVHDPADPTSLIGNNIYALLTDQQGQLWVGTNMGVDILPPGKQSFDHSINQFIKQAALTDENIAEFIEDKNGIIWIATYHTGLYRFNQKTKEMDSYSHDAQNPNSLINDRIRSLLIDRYNQLWVGTSRGLNIYNPKEDNFALYVNDPSVPSSLSNSYIWEMLEDNNDSIWLGTSDGLNQFVHSTRFFGHRHNTSTSGKGLSHKRVRSLFKTKDNVLWVGVNNGLNRLDPKTGRYTYYQHDNAIASTISRGMVMSILVDSKNRVWVGTYDGGLNLLLPSGGFQHFIPEKDNPASLSNLRVYAIKEDKKGFLWLATNDGLNRFDTTNQTFERFFHQPGNINSLSFSGIYTVLPVASGDIWVGSRNGGLNRYNPSTGDFQRYEHDLKNPKSISHNRIFSLYQPNADELWVGTSRGLNRLDIATGTFSHFGKKQGLLNETIYAVTGDEQGFIWVSTNHGLARYNPITGRFKNFDKARGLQSAEFNNGSFFNAPDGELLFGGINGFNRFYPRNIQDNTQVPAVILTDFRLANQSVPIQLDTLQKNNAIFTLPKTINALRYLNLSYTQNLITFEFAALHFMYPQNNQYAYMLQGQDEDWIYTDAKNRRATYTNLPAGDYTLRIKASNGDGYWNEQGKSLKITITPPPWKTWWAYSIYTLFILGIVWAFVHAQRKKVIYQQSVNRQLKQVDKLKDEFLANTSHELRTPLNGIIGLAESLIDGVAGQLPDKANHNLAMVVSSGKRLSNLINDVLDFAKLKNRNLTLHTKSIDLYSMVEVVLTLSRPILANKNLELINSVAKDLPGAEADENRLQQIFHNIIGNAIKFTESGKVAVSVVQDDNMLTINITDTGIGIDKKYFATLFDSFEQIESHTQRAHSGTGLGLSVSKQLVELHGGTIAVESATNQGSTFSFTLPVSAEKPSTNTSFEQVVTRLHALSEPDDPLPIKPKTSHNQCRILLVDDEPMNLQVLHNHLTLQDYQLVEATGGEQALQSIEQDGPFDLILLDVMMPKVSGFEVCSQLRKTHSLNDLPVIFLTAKNQVADMVESFTVGANDYLSKPVSKHELLTRVETHLKFLDIHRNLEGKVAARTAELEHKNKEIIDTQQQLVQSEKMASLGTLTAGVAHEINNPNNFIHVSSQNLEADLIKTQQFFIDLAGDEADEEILASFRQQFEPFNHHLDTIKEGSNRIKTIVQDLRTFTQLDNAEQNTVVITDLLKATVNLVQAQHQKVIDFELVFEDIPQLHCYPARLNQVFMNLIVNACHAIKTQADKQQKGQITIGCRPINDAIEVSIKDNGCGMTDETKNKLFEPFYTTKKVGEGTGLGLSISFGIVSKHGGQIHVESQLGVGTTFIIELPNMDIGKDSVPGAY